MDFQSKDCLPEYTLVFVTEHEFREILLLDALLAQITRLPATEQHSYLAIYTHATCSEQNDIERVTDAQGKTSSTKTGPKQNVVLGAPFPQLTVTATCPITSLPLERVFRFKYRTKVLDRCRPSKIQVPSSLPRTRRTTRFLNILHVD